MSESFQHRANKVLQRINKLAGITEESGSVTRRLGTPAFIEGAQLVESWMSEAGLETRIDSIGNVRGRWNSDKLGAKTFVIASHIDTVVNAGKYDGPLGVVMAIDLIENLKANYRALPFDIEIIAFSDEEGVRFHTTFLGSQVITGTFNKDWLQKKDAEGMSMEDVIRVFGGHAETLSQEAISREKWLGYYEMHIEQGPVLYDKNIPVALVTSIAGQKRIAVSLSGMAGHAGTVPMDKRLDALCAAAECTLAMETFALTEKDRLVVTVGILQIPHSAGNVIPGEVHFTIDIRSGDKPFLDIATKRIQTICAEIVSKRGLDMQWELIQETNPVVTDATLNQLLKNAIIQSEIPIVELVSGAGHDAVPVSQIAPVSMMFIRCYKGISHNPLEQAAINDIAQAIKVSDSFMKNLIKHYSSIS